VAHVCDLDVDLVRHTGIGRLTPCHVHTGHFELICVDAGSLAVCVADRCLVFRVGDVAVVEPRVCHALHALPGFTCAYRSIRLPHQGSDALPDDAAADGTPPRPWPAGATFERLFDGLSNSRGDRRALIRAALRPGGLRGSVRLPRPPAADAVPALRPLRDYVHTHFNEPVRLRDLAEMSGMSPPYVGRTFRKAFGLPPHAYQIQLKIERAKALLCEGANIAAVADTVGFADQSHLTRHFKRLVGVTPAQYRHVRRNVEVFVTAAARRAQKRTR
jgi:AraC-like DNA-binding protein